MEELRVSITADASGVGPGIAEATQQVTASADTIAAAQARATASAKALADAQAQLGAAAAAGNSQAAAIIQEYAAASKEAQAAVDALTSAENANTAATAAGTAAKKADTAATYNRAAALGAARIEMGALSGSIGGVESGLARLAASSALVGPIMAAMVPLALFVAAAVIVWDLGKAIAEAFDVGSEKAREFQLGVSELDGSFRSLIDSTSLEADKIEAANAKLEHKPTPNALKEAIDQALVDADQMNSKLDGLISKEEKLLKMQGLQGSGTERFLFNETGSRQEQVDLEQHEIHMAKAVTLEQQLAESKRFTAVEQARLLSLSEKQAAIDAVRNTNQGLSAAMTIVGVSDLHKELDALDLIVGKTKQETTAIEEQIRKRDAQVKHDQLTGEGKTPREPKAKADNLPEQIGRAQIEAAHASDAELDPVLKIMSEFDKQVALNNLKAKTSKEGTAAEREQLRVLENQTAETKARAQIQAQVEKHGADNLIAGFAEQDKANKVQLEQQGAAAEAEKTARQTRIEGVREQASFEIEAARQDFEATQEKVRQQEQLGLISHQVAEKRLRDAERMRESKTQRAMASELSLYDPAVGGKELNEYKHVQDQMTLEAKKSSGEREKLAAKEATQLEQVYKRVANTFNQDFTAAFNSWAKKSQTAGQAFGHMLGEMELQVADFAAKTILEHFEMWAQIKLMNALGIETTQSQQAIANLKEVTADAKVAAANAYKWASAWGGPPAGAIAAGVAFTAVEAFGGGVFDTGGMMGHMTYALNTSGSPERVLSPSQTRTFETMVNQGGAHTAHLNYAPTIHGDVNEKMLEAHSNQMMNKLRGMIRPEAWQ